MSNDSLDLGLQFAKSEKWRSVVDLETLESIFSVLMPRVSNRLKHGLILDMPMRHTFV